MGSTMKPLSIADIFESFTKKQLKHVSTPAFEGVEWEKLDFFSWHHVSGHISFVFYPMADRSIGIVLHKAKGTNKTCSVMFSWCLTIQRGNEISLYSSYVNDNPYNIVEDYVCKDLRCSLYLRKILPLCANQMPESLSIESRSIRLKQNLERFISLVYPRQLADPK